MDVGGFGEFTIEQARHHLWGKSFFSLMYGLAPNASQKLDDALRISCFHVSGLFVSFFRSGPDGFCGSPSSSYSRHLCAHVLLRFSESWSYLFRHPYFLYYAILRQTDGLDWQIE